MYNVIKYICINVRTARFFALVVCYTFFALSYLESAENPKTAPRELTVVASPQNGGSVTGSGKYAPGTVVEIRAVPAVGFVFSRWEGTVVSPANPATKTYIGAEARWITAIFEPKRHMIEGNVVPFGAGTIDGSGYQPGGVAVPVHAMPAPGYMFDKWEGPVTAPTKASTTLKAPLTGTVKLTAYFKPAVESCNVTVVAELGGTATGSGVYKRGEKVALKAVPSTNFIFAGWDGPVASTGDAETTVYVTGDLAITAKFMVARSLLRGRVSPAGAGRVIADFGSKPVGIPVPVSAEAAPGYVFAGWDGPVADRKKSSTTVTPVAGKSTVVIANFKPIK